MKQIRWIMGVSTVLMVLAVTVLLITLQPKADGKQKEYLVEVNRIYDEIQHYIQEKTVKTGEMPDIGKEDFISGRGYIYVMALSYWGSSLNGRQLSEKEFFEGKGARKDCQVYILPVATKEREPSFLRFEYRKKVETYTGLKETLLIIIVGIWLIAMTCLFYVEHSIIQPFHKIEQLPYELAKGHLSMELKESKYHYFGKFVWGLDALRETLKKNKARQLELEKEKKMMILSISHDIKTPLSSIYLYNKALKEGLYEGEKCQEIYDKLQNKAGQIESFVAEIEKMSTEDILQLPVNSRDTYINEFMEPIREIYTEKFALLHTKFTIERYPKKLVCVDKDRMIEAMENILENAIKYGDGRDITISSTEEEYCLLITIENSGVPVEEKDFPHLFESFWRGANGKNQTGSGLGLYICKEIMRKMNGDVYASRTENTMSFTLVIPEM